jgi:hypothetical protein
MALQAEPNAQGQQDKNEEMQWWFMQVFYFSATELNSVPGYS